MARATQSKTIRIISEIDGSPINSGLVQLKRGATTYNMVSVGNGYFRNEAVLPGEYNVFYDSLDTNATEAVGAGEVDRLDTSENINSIYITGPSGTPELSPFISISNVENLQTELDGKLDVDGNINSTTGINSDIQGALDDKIDEGGDISSTTGINSDIQSAIDDNVEQNFCYLDFDGTSTPFNHGTQNVWSVINFWDSTNSNNIIYNGDTGDDLGSYTFDLPNFNKWYRAILNLSLSASVGSHSLELAIESKLDTELWPENDTGAIGDNIVIGSVKPLTIDSTGGSFTQVTRALISEKAQVRVIWRCTSGSSKTTNISYGIKEITKVP